MTDAFKVYIDRLKSGEVQKIEGSFVPSFLELDEDELHFKAPIELRGEAYIAEDHLVIHLHAKTFIEMPCAVCNEMIQVPLTSGNFYHTEPLADIPSALYDFGLAVREALLIELPRTAECNGGKCPARETIAPYMRSEKKGDTTTHFPFADFDIKP